MQLKKIAIIDNAKGQFFADKHINALADAFPELEIVYGRNGEELLSKTADADALITLPFADYSAFCAGAKSLKWVHGVLSGVDGFARSGLMETDLHITSTKGIHGFSMAEQVLSYIFAFTRSLPMCFRRQQEKKFDAKLKYTCDEVAGKTAGIIGYGNIGKAIAEKCKAVGMNVAVVNRTVPPVSAIVDESYPVAQLDVLLKKSDFVVITLPLTPDTEHFIGARELAQMKGTAILINIARGPVVDEDALIRALQSGAIAGAGLDVFTREPLPPDSPLWELENVIITPHSAGQSPYYMDRAVGVMAENIKRYLADEPLLYEVDRTRGY